MRRGRVFIYIAFILILGLAAVFVVYQRFLQPASTPTVEAGDATPAPVVQMANIVIVQQRVPRGDLLTPEVLGVVPWQQDAVLQGMYQDINEVVGRQVKFDLEAGIPLTAGMLVNPGEQLSSTGSVAALSIPRGMVAVSIPINRLASVSYAPQAGDHVNVIASLMLVDLDTDFQTALPNRAVGVIGTGTGVFKGTTGASTPGGEGVIAGQGEAGLEVESNSLVAVPGGGGEKVGRPENDPILGQTLYVIPGEGQQRPRLVSQTLLQDVIVLRMGDFPLEPEKPVTPEQAPGEAAAAEGTGQSAVAGAEPEEKAAPPNPDVITLIVTPQDAITLNYMIFNNAKLTLVLRAAGDDTRVQTEAVTLQFLLDQYRIPVPVKLPYGVEPPLKDIQFPTMPNDQPTPEP